MTRLRSLAQSQIGFLFEPGVTGLFVHNCTLS